jgi:hypothetical protein
MKRLHPFRSFAVVLVVSMACSPGSGPDTSSGRGSPTATKGTTRRVSREMARIACSVPRAQLMRIRNGYDPRRSGDIQFITRAPNVLGTYFPHSGPWPYLQRVPMLWYGPGQVPGVEVNRSVTMADVAPTIARFLRFPFKGATGKPMTEALRSPEGQPERPRLVLVVVWDGGGRDVLDEHAEDWPVLRRLMNRGAWYENATVGSSPTHTAAVHATLGTGTFPRRHGRIDGLFRMEGRIVRPEGIGPRDLLVPSLADLYDRANGNAPLVGVVGATPWHLGMAGSGSYLKGGDRDIAVLQLRVAWGLGRNDSKFFLAPSYATRMDGYEELRAQIDREDGVIDDSWYADRFVDGSNVLLKHTTIEWQTRLIREIVRREGFGDDRLPDLLFVNYKQIDAVGHGASMNSPDMGAVVRRTDAALGKLVDLLNAEAGRGRWVLVMTADHGSTPKGSASGGFAIPIPEFLDDLRAAFDDDDDADILQASRVNQMWVNWQEMQENGVSLEDISRWIVRYRYADAVADPSVLSDEQASQRLFAAAFPSYVLDRLPCLERE